MSAQPETVSTGVNETIPVLDVGAYLRGEPGALTILAADLRQALEEIGFFFTVNHSVSQELIDRTFAETARFHALPKSEKIKVAINDAHVGYMDNEGELPRTSPYYPGTLKPDAGEAFFIKREIAPFPLPIQNQWPANLSGFRTTLNEYFESTEAFFRQMLPVFATALELPANYFDSAFSRYEALSVLRVAHFPPDPLEPDQFNVGPHTDSSFVTLLATSSVPGLQLLGRSGQWFPAPPIPGSILFNSGDMVTRWTNGRFLSTPHRVPNRSGRDRYSIPLFIHPNPDFEIRCLPTCSDYVAGLSRVVHERKLQTRCKAPLSDVVPPRIERYSVGWCDVESRWTRQRDWQGTWYCARSLGEFADPTRIEDLASARFLYLN